MAKLKPIKKKSAQISAKSSVKAKPIKKVVARKGRSEINKPKNYGWMIAGFDLSLSSIAGAAMAYDGILKKLVGPAFVMRSWSSDDHYFDRLKEVAKGHEFIWDLQAELKLGNMPLSKIFIAQEEPFPSGSFIRSGNSSALKQQAEISGAFLGGLLRFGYENLWQLHNTTWRKVVADDLGITIHHSKWKDPELVKIYNCHPDNTGKFRAKQWAMSSPGPGYAFMHMMSEEIPDWPDIIKRNGVKIPRPEGSNARAIQPDDRYDALAIMWAQYLDLSKQGILK